MIKKFTQILKLFVLTAIAVFTKTNMLAQSAPTASQTFSYTGSVEQFTVPPCVGSMTIIAKGASGATSGAAGSNGGIVSGVMTATPGQVMFFNVGGQGSVTTGGFNGGGNGGISSTSNGGGGGGASDVRIGGNGLANRIIVAGAGGGGGGNSTYSPISGAGGAGSAFTSASGFGGGGAGGCASGASGGESGGAGTSYGSGGGGGGFTSGGGGGGQGSSTGGYGCAGALGTGGAGGGTSFICGGATGGVNGGGGGGGGYYGGGGGMTGTGGCNGGGGGGSSWVQTSMFSSIAYTSGVNTTAGHGFITIIYAFNGSLTNASVTPFAICQGQTATITANGSSTYTWNTSSQSNSITVNPSSNTTYTVTGTNSIGCISTAIITVTVTPGIPTLAITSSTNQVCLGRTATLSASGALTYTWSNGITNGVSFTPSVTSNYTVSGQNGCGTTSAVTTITVAPLPVTAVSSSSAVCAGNVATLTAASAATSYTWQPFNLPGAVVAVSPTATTVFSVSASDGTCSGNATVVLIANPNPTVVSSISHTSICEGAVVTLSASGANGYTWTPGNLTGAVITVTPNTPTQYSVFGDNSIGCLGGSSQIVIVYPSPTLNILASDPIICVGGTSTLTVTGADTYTWSNSAVLGSVSVNPLTTTVYSVSGSFTSGAGCSSSTIITVGVFIPTLAINGSTSSCAGKIVSLNASGGASWQWSNGATSQGISVTPLTTTIYSVTALTTSGSINCPSSSSIQLLVYPNPTLTATSSRSAMCKGETNTISVSGASTYTWNTGSTNSTVVITPTLVTLLTFSVDAKSTNGCSGTTTLQVRVNACTDINENQISKHSLSVYPNPSNGNFTIVTEEEMDLNIVNELGQIVNKISITSENHFQSKIVDLPNGIYFINSSPESKRNINQKVIVIK